MKPILSGLFAGLLLAGVAGAQTPTFKQPTPEQIEAAAATPPEQLGTLLEGADADQSATVVASVIEAVLRLGLSPADQTARIEAVIGIALNALPPASQAAFATALGQKFSASPAIAAATTVIPAVQNALAAANVALGEAFGAAATSGNRPDAPPQDPPPETPPDDALDTPDPILHPPPPEQETPAGDPPPPSGQSPEDPPPTSDPYRGQSIP